MGKQIKEDAMVSTIPVNMMGTSSSTAGTGGVDTYDPFLRSSKKKKLRDIIKRKAPV